MSLLFLMWSVSGIVLVFKGFPHASGEERFQKLEYLNESDFTNLPLFDEINSGEIGLEKYQGNLVYRKEDGRKSQKIWDAHTLKLLTGFTKVQAIKEAEQFTGAKVEKIDSVVAIDSWIPWGYYKPLLPFYKCYMSDAEHSVVYVSSKIGTVIQHTTRYSRWMARFGAIPHLMYFPQIKQYAKRWENTILILGLMGLLVTISGLVAAFFRFKRDQAGKITGITVYKKWSYKWHHIFGLFIGLFFCTFLLSGIFYATDVPSWISAKPKGKSPQTIWNQRLETDSTMHAERIWNLLPEKKGLRKIAWGTAMGFPAVEAYYDNYRAPVTYKVNGDTILLFNASEKGIEQYAHKKFRNTLMKIEQQVEYDIHYKANGMYSHPLPVYKLNLNDGFNSALYIDPASGKAVEYYNANKGTERILTRGLHKLDFAVFLKADGLRSTILIFLSIGGIIVSFTGVLLSFKWFRRVFKSKKQHGLTK